MKFVRRALIAVAVVGATVGATSCSSNKTDQVALKKMLNGFGITKQADVDCVNKTAGKLDIDRIQKDAQRQVDAASPLNQDSAGAQPPDQKAQAAMAKLMQSSMKCVPEAIGNLMVSEFADLDPELSSEQMICMSTAFAAVHSTLSEADFRKTAYDTGASNWPEGAQQTLRTELDGCGASSEVVQAVLDR
jgi:hypothetical protein